MNNNQAQNTIQAPILSGFSGKTTAKKALGNRDLKGKVAIVTGGYSGIGLETTRVLAEAGATVIVPARTLEKARAAVQGIPNVELEVLNLMDPKSIDAFAERFLSTGRPLHILINSAGIMASPLMRDKRGYEAQFATNHLGHFHLTARLWPALKRAGTARVVAVSSRAQRLGGVNFEDPNFETTEYDKWKAYAGSKSANVLFAVELDRLAKLHGVRAFSVHPGLIPTTGIGRFSRDDKASKLVKSLNGLTLTLMDKLNIIKLINLTKKGQGNKLKTIKQGAATSIWCATSDALDGSGGVYCEDCDIAEAVPADSTKGYGVRPWAIDPDYAKKLWTLSEKLAGVRFEF
ncbi:MAG: SDR family NAD(P)-dependent oxidoreductase [Gorillibacterium sp.]|nr:SDR family NAD(P)-dependent oxidoreductase [Gorillibacterium sp.]